MSNSTRLVRLLPTRSLLYQLFWGFISFVVTGSSEIQLPRLATQLPIYPACDQYQLTPGASICNSSFPSRLQPFYLLIRPGVTVLIMAQYPKWVRWFSRNHMNLSLARRVANLKVPYSLNPFNQQGSARVCSSRAFPANSRTPVWSFFTVHRGVLLVVAKEV